MHFGSSVSGGKSVCAIHNNVVYDVFPMTPGGACLRRQRWSGGRPDVFRHNLQIADNPRRRYCEPNSIRAGPVFLPQDAHWPHEFPAAMSGLIRQSAGRLEIVVCQRTRNVGSCLGKVAPAQV